MTTLPPNSVTTTAPGRGAYRAWGVGLLALGLILLAHNLRLLPPAVMMITQWWPVLVVALAVTLFIRGTLAFPLPSFAIPRALFEAASLTVSSGLSGVQLAAFAGSTQLAVGRFPLHHGPGLKTEGGWARIELDDRAALPFMPGDWSVSLAKGLPWSLVMRSLAGDLTLDLHDLSVAALQLQALFGDADVALPAAGQGTWDFRLTFGDLTLRVPEAVAVQLRVRAGALAHGQVAHPRFALAAPGEWTTLNYADAAQRLTIEVELGAGDLVVV